MVFSSVTFLIYFLPIVLVLYLIIPNYFKNIFLLIASVLFYSWGAPKFIFVILATTTLDFYLVQLMAGSAKEKTRNLFLNCFAVSILRFIKICTAASIGVTISSLYSHHI